MRMKAEKTNALRLLDAAGIKYDLHEYDAEEDRGEEVARLVGKDCDEVFKTLVTVSDKGVNFVFVIPVNTTLNLKKAARAAGAKSVQMIKQKELFPLTGYVHGGCSPVGMKKAFATFINETAVLFDTVCVSAGKRGLQMEISPASLMDYTGATYADLTD
ncbi:MAG: Cys-tRNA(Pro) deacylase [Clostridia bacterium]|nr:Cys-tRNA(Pro) deacylase [Clostridia bacterium]MBR2969381.1 Cys-tRNA(Pro) deacylase [Clostridia bacterium]